MVADAYITFSKINDFLFSPKSLYLHSLYQDFSENVYHESPQKVGKLNHLCIDASQYSTSKKYIQGLSVYSEKYNIGGKIDIYDATRQALIERKTYARYVHDGYRFQLFGQMFAMEETGYPVKDLIARKDLKVVTLMVMQMVLIILLERELLFWKNLKTINKLILG